ncbi:DUF262 domain-containing protein (plasmid) [Aneurinibacillus sp. Ricciae_BoGa-3]|uniref:DUF262 domain-containing protein n=1 Tax=Aneurinibacillus sp. Ricciae_BoGa-3 TaxID=3022697 RepID=UPI00234216FC|nr:DUF262 domain-containing protein [Aneurinibacillus sp. Ricciae_BoGa-3]WCK57435.1 DUF262 domain-containing protein [Aneurinibacillus sp. Ricciae_BoGa-3]
METAMMTTGTEMKEEEIRIIVPQPGMKWGFFTIDVSRDEMSVAQFMNRLEVFKFNDPIQRNCVWPIIKKSLLIVSILEEVSIGEIKTEIVRHNKKKFRNVLDGKQRLTTIRDYIRGRFALVNAFVRCFDADGNQVKIDISGMSFDDLPQHFQERIMALILDIKSYDDLDEKMKAELFQRWNNGEILKPSQLRKSKMSYELLFGIASLKELEVFNAGFSESAVNNDTHSDMLLKALSVLKTDNNTGLDNNTLNRFLDEKSFTAENIEELKELGHYLNETYKLLEEKAVKKSFGASKTVTLLYVARKAKEENRSYEEFANWIESFFVKDYKKSGYATTSGTAKLDSVKRRNSIGMEHYTTYFSKLVA